MTALRLTLLVPVGAMLLAACGSTQAPAGVTAATTSPSAGVATAATTPAATAAPVIPASSRAVPSASAAPTLPKSTLAITQLGINMHIPAGLTWVSYQINQGGPALQDTNGVSHKATAQVVFSTPQWEAVAKTDPLFTPGSQLMVVTVWNVDPSSLTGFGYGAQGSVLDVKVGARWLHVEAVDGLGDGPAVELLVKQDVLLTKMVATAVLAQA